MVQNIQEDEEGNCNRQELNKKTPITAVKWGQMNFLIIDATLSFPEEVTILHVAGLLASGLKILLPRLLIHRCE